MLYADYATLYTTLARWPWMRQLEFLSTHLYCSGPHRGNAISCLSAISAAPLQVLELSIWFADSVFYYQHLNLPAVTNLKLMLYGSGLEHSKVFEGLTRATMPALKNLTIEALSSWKGPLQGIEAFLTKVPQLKSMKLSMLKIDEQAAESIATDLLPHLEECCFEFVNSDRECMGHMFASMVRYANENAIFWPRLKKLCLFNRYQCLYLTGGFGRRLLDMALLPIAAVAPNLEVLNAPKWRFETEFDLNEAVQAAGKHKWGVREVTFLKITEVQKAALKQIWPFAQIHSKE